ncbi:MAG: flagellar hook-associated family protein [Mesorhizobium sp.]
MKTSFVSTSAINQALRYSMVRLQSDLTKGQTEMATLRVADVGLALGNRTGQSVSLGRDISRLNSVVDSNALASSRLSSTQSILGQLAERGEELRSTLAAALSGDSQPGIVQQDAVNMIEAMTSMLNTSYNGAYLFGGINTDVQPFADFRDPASPNRVAFDNAFMARFGFSQDDPQAATITKAEMEDFIDNDVTSLFMGSDWSDWSSASDQPIVSRIALNETAETSVSANITGVRKLALAAAISSSLLASGYLNDGAVSAVVERALGTVAEGVAEINDVRTVTGINETRVKNATARIEMQVDLFERSVQGLEGVDPYEASTRVSALVTQIETAYSLTSRLQQLSLLKFI